MSPLPYDDDDVVLVVDGQVRGRKKTPPASPSAWLKTWTPEGVYTSARTYRGIKVSRWGRTSRGFAGCSARSSRTTRPSSRASACPRRTRRWRPSSRIPSRRRSRSAPCRASKAPATVRANARQTPTRPRPPPSPSPHATLLSPPLAVLGASLGGEVMLVVAVSPKPETEAIASACTRRPSTTIATTTASWSPCARPPANSRRSSLRPGPRTASGSARTPRRTPTSACSPGTAASVVEGLTNNLFVVVKGPDGKPRWFEPRPRGVSARSRARGGIGGVRDGGYRGGGARAGGSGAEKVERGLRHKRRAPGEADSRGAMAARGGRGPLSGRRGRRAGRGARGGARGMPGTGHEADTRAAGGDGGRGPGPERLTIFLVFHLARVGLRAIKEPTLRARAEGAGIARWGAKHSRVAVPSARVTNARLLDRRSVYSVSAAPLAVRLASQSPNAGVVR